MLARATCRFAPPPHRRLRALRLHSAGPCARLASHHRDLARGRAAPSLLWLPACLPSTSPPAWLRQPGRPHLGLDLRSARLSQVCRRLRPRCGRPGWRNQAARRLASRRLSGPRLRSTATTASPSPTPSTRASAKRPGARSSTAAFGTVGRKGTSTARPAPRRRPSPLPPRRRRRRPSAPFSS